MALAGKNSAAFYVTTGAGDDKINTTRKSELAALAAADKTKGNKYIINDDTLGPLIYNIQLMQDDLDELRRYVVGEPIQSGNLVNHGGIILDGNNLKLDLTDVNSATGPLDVAKGGTGITGQNYYPVLTKKVTISQAQMNNIEDPTNAVDLIAAPGSGKMINILNVQAFADIADPTQQLQTNSRANMHVGYDNGGNPFQLGASTMFYARRFMNGASGDALTVFQYGLQRIGTIPANTKVVITGEDRQAFPNNCFTSVDVYITYQIINV